ncbi:MAG: J domain-containing protein [Alphaproteobacteria bacterium]
MTLDSKYFDGIRIKSAAAKPKGKPRCEWRDCTKEGGYRAPKGRANEREFFNFCLDHVREYNKSYNYFSGMPDDEIVAYRDAAATGHRPTWAMGSVGSEAKDQKSQPKAMRDVFGVFEGQGPDFQPEKPQKRPLKNLERRSFVALNLDGGESSGEITARYKLLVKRLHPDANGGDRGSEDKLREIIQAYKHLKAAGFC